MKFLIFTSKISRSYTYHKAAKDKYHAYYFKLLAQHDDPCQIFIYFGTQWELFRPEKSWTTDIITYNLVPPSLPPSLLTSKYHDTMQCGAVGSRVEYMALQ